MTQPDAQQLSPQQSLESAPQVAVDESGKKGTVPVDSNYDVLDNLLKLATGNAQLVTRPGLLASLQQNNATPAQASAINSYMTGLDAANQVQMARVSGAKLNLTPDQEASLAAMGENYSDVVAPAVKPAATSATTTGTTGGQPVTASGAPAAKKKSSSGWFASPGSFLHHVVAGASQVIGNAVGGTGGNMPGNQSGRNAILGAANKAPGDIAGATGVSSLKTSTVTGLVSAPLNITQATLAQNLQVDKADVTGGGDAGISQRVALDTQQAQAMTASGYDPSNPWSVVAYNAKGYAHTDTSDLADGWDKQNPGLFNWNGQQAVAAAESYLSNPSTFESGLLNGMSAQEKADLDAGKTLTPAEQADINRRSDILSSPAFSNLVKEVGGRSATVGNTFARTVGLDPVKDSGAYSLVSAGVDTAAAFAVDPTILAGSAYQAAKFSAIGLRDASDTEGIRAALDPTSSSLQVKAQVRGAQSFIDDMNQVREGLDAGTEEGKTQAITAMAHANATTPGLMPLAQDVMGASRLDDAGRVVHNVEPLDTLGKLTDYLANSTGMLRLVSGQAATEAKYLPGKVSAFGYRFFKGNAAAFIAGKSRTLDLRSRRVLDDLTVTPENAVDADTGEKIVQTAQTNPAGEMPPGAPGPVNPRYTQPAVADADISNPEVAKSPVGDVNTGEAPPVMGATGPVMPSQARAATPAELGDLRQLNLQTQLRSRLALVATRLSTELPRNNQIILGDADAPDKIYKLARTFLSKSDAHLAQAISARGGEGVMKSVIDGLNEQIMHASGATSTDAGKALQANLQDLNAQTYGHLGNEGIADPFTGRESDAAIGLGQLQSQFHLLNFASVHQAQAKLGIWGHTLGTAFIQHAADTFTSFLKLAWLAKPNVGLRNEIEGQANIATRGQYIDFLQAKSMLVDTAKSAGEKAVADAKAEGVTDTRALRQTRRAAQAQILTNRKSVIDKAVSNIATRRVGDLYRSVVLKTMNPAMRAMMQDELSGDEDSAAEWRALNLGYSEQIPREALDPHGADSATMILHDGIPVAKSTRAGYEVGPTGGVTGADRYSSALHYYFGHDVDLDHALIEAVENPSGDVSGIVQALKAPHLAGVVDSARRSHIYVDEAGVSRAAVTPEEKDQALQQWAQHYLTNASYLLHSAPDKDGNVQYLRNVSQYISEKGKAPFGDWIRDNIKDEQRPAGALGARYAGLAMNDKLGFTRLLLDSGGKGFKWMVEDPIKRTTSEPAYLMNVARQRVVLSGFEKRIADHLFDTSYETMAARHAKELSDADEAGMSLDNQALLQQEHEMQASALRDQSDASARKIVRDAAHKRAYVQTESMIDDPGLKTQADVVGRNFLMFSRAITAFARRWGGAFIEDPTRLRKLMLVNEGAHHAGFTYTDANGNLNFTYPGSDAAMGALARVTKFLPGLGTGVQYALSGGLTGQVNMIAPGMDNPVRFTTSPMLNIPAAFLEKLAPQDQQLWDQINTALNGQDESGKNWYSDLVPGAIGKFTAAHNSDRNSALNSATVSAIMNLEAADPYAGVPDDQLPAGAKRIVPGPSATPQDIQTWLHNVQQQVKNQLYLRAAFGEFLPAAPGVPDESVSGNGPDALLADTGVKNLDTEYKMLLNEAGGDRAVATAIFTAQHPGRLVYTQPTSVSTTSKAYLPDTKPAETWIDTNESFISKYSTVAAYFLPQQNGDFDMAAYNAQLETGLRQRKTPTEFLDGYLNTVAANLYYAADDKKDAAVDQALSTNNTSLASSIRDSFDAWDTQFNATHPVWAANESSLDTAEEVARTQVTELQKMLADPDIPKSVQAFAPKLQSMIASYQNQQAWLTAHPAKTAIEIAENSAELLQYEAHMTGLVGNDPNLTNIYNGVFKPLNYTPSGG